MFTVEIFKRDRRCKSGERSVLREDYNTDNLNMLYHTVKLTWPMSQGYRYEIKSTSVTRKNIMSGEEFQMRSDTPLCCDPSSETYWSC